MRVLYVIGGTDDPQQFPFVRRQIESLEQCGVQAERFFLESRLHPRKLGMALWELKTAVTRFRPDVIHAQYGSATAFVSSLVGRTPLVITFRGSDLRYCPEHSRIRNIAAHLLSRLAALRAAHTICVSDNLKMVLGAGSNASVIPTGINLDHFRPLEQNSARERLGLRSERPYLLFNASNSPVLKGLALAEQVHRLVRQAVPETELLVLRGNVANCQMRDYYNAASCLLLCSQSEGSPNVVKEAMACNLPVVSVDVGDVRKRTAGVSFCTVTPRCPIEMAEAVKSVLASGDRSSGRDRIQSIAEPRVAAEILKVYHQVASNCRSIEPQPAFLPSATEPR